MSSCLSAEQRVPGGGGSNSDSMHQHAVVQGVGELCKRQRQWYELAITHNTALHSNVVYIKKKTLFSYTVFSEPPGHIDNSKIGVMKGGHIQLKQGEPQRW